MMPPTHELTLRLTRRSFLAMLATCVGCASPLMRGQTPEEELPEAEEKRLEYVGDYTRPWGLNWVKLESVALVTNLENTGSDPPPSPQREQLVGEMQSHDVRHADKVLAQPSNSMVIVYGYLPPNVQKGDVFDVEVRTPSRSDTTSLHGGWLMQTRLRQMEVLGGAIRTGSVEGVAQGDLVVDAVFDGESDKMSLKRARVLGGAISGISRKLGLMIANNESSIRISIVMGAAINKRFHTFDAGVKKGVAEPQRDNFIELAVSPRYKHNLGRYLRVVRHIPLKENPVERAERLVVLEKKLLEPSSSATAALQLEAIGKEGIDILKKGLTSADAEVRFYAAEALAYQDVAEAAPVLRVTADRESAFRWHALTALTAMDNLSAYDALNELLHAVSVETRYGAFRALRARNPQDPVTKGEVLEKKFSYHLLSTTGEPLVHITRAKRPEIVVFGNEMRLKNPQALFAGKKIMVKTVGPDEIKVSRFTAGSDDQDQHEVCTAELDKVLRCIVQLGASYADVVQFLREAKKTGCLEARLAVEALPAPGRKFQRRHVDDSDNGPPTAGEENAPASDSSENLEFTRRQAATPSPELFNDRLGADDDKPERREEVTETYVDPTYRESQSPGILDKLSPFSTKRDDFNR